MIGYHFTVERHWKRIQIEGLRPSVVPQFTPMTDPVICLFFNETQFQVTMVALTHCLKHHDLRAVVLAVEFDHDDIYDGPGFTPSYNVHYHDGSLGANADGSNQVVYHRSQPMLCLGKTIEPSKLSVVQWIDFTDNVVSLTSDSLKEAQPWQSLVTT